MFAIEIVDDLGAYFATEFVFLDTIDDVFNRFSEEMDRTKKT